MSISKQKLREEEILKVCEQNAFITKYNYYLISQWELAWNLNNWWNAYLFTNQEHAKKRDLDVEDTYWAVESFNINKLFRMITWTINRMKGAKIIKQGPKSYPITFYKIRIVRKK